MEIQLIVTFISVIVNFGLMIACLRNIWVITGEDGTKSRFGMEPWFYAFGFFLMCLLVSAFALIANLIIFALK